jgi:demethylmenaquinone methyltransferase/2-methoxy-6-polyprenyl-1,4-benzoquinol methylase
VVVAADFALGMLAVAREKMRGVDEARRVRLMAADALALPFETRTFACVTSAFLLRNLADLEQGLREMKRVSRPGGRVVALEITQMRAPGFAPLFRLYFHHVVPWVGQLVGGDREAYTYLPQSVDRFVTPTELSAVMEKVGLRGVRYRRLGLGTVTVHVGIA